MKVTVPVGLLPVTVAVKVTVFPKVVGLGLAVSVVPVGLDKLTR
jgi:hypothetical protein